MKLSFDVEQARTAMYTRGNYQLEGIFSEGDLTEVEQILDRLMNSSSTLIQPFRHSLNCEQESPRQQLELIRPSVLSRELRKSAAFSTAQALASQILGAKAHYQFDHAIYKSPSAAAVPWHQDQAYSGSGSTPSSIHLWIPFQDSGPENGGMIFIEQSKPDLLAHSPLTTGSRTLTLSQPIAGEPRYVRVSRGGLSVHHNFTVHASGENRSNQPRKAWIVHFARTTLWRKYWPRLRAPLSFSRKSPPVGSGLHRRCQ